MHICPEWSVYIPNAISRQCIRFKIFIISEIGQHVDKCPDGQSFQRILPFILWLCIFIQPPARTVPHTAKYTFVFPILYLVPFAPNLPPLFSAPSFILNIYFSPGLIQGLHLKFSFNKQKNILLEGNGIKEKWFSVCPEAGHRRDLICYVRLESGLIRRDERGCLIKFTFHFFTWHPSPVTHDEKAANTFCQNPVAEERLGDEKAEGREGTSRAQLVPLLWFLEVNKSTAVGGHESQHPPLGRSQCGGCLKLTWSSCPLGGGAVDGV